MKRLNDFLQFLRDRVAVSGPASTPKSLSSEWFVVTFDEMAISLKVDPPNRDSWVAQIEWKDIIRVCFYAGNLEKSDLFYIFTDQRPESYVIPDSGTGAAELWDEIVHRRLFDPALAIQAMSALDQLFCFPEE